ncbi:HDOD domain-containing protein [Alteromonas sp. LMIT006]|uniref:HDOD domain-containing protein n=1 Tax=Alteromonadaceae TaxID=72275 RepID=UPI0020CA6014|nr:HDOD domain-containing protein [Alteromonas sp. LMIT006]UTP72185.1 HDOD domain-containing protein [Alteromonas sp. LMIT006]
MPKKSSIYNFRDPVDSITRAVKILGTKAIYDLAISLGLNQSSLDKSVDNIRHCLLTVVSLFTTNGYGIN